MRAIAFCNNVFIVPFPGAGYQPFPIWLYQTDIDRSKQKTAPSRKGKTKRDHDKQSMKGKQYGAR